MGQAQFPMETTAGFSPPTVTQFSVFLDNRVGKLHELLRAFDHAAVQICAFSVHDASDHAVVRLITNSFNECKHLLQKHQLAFTETSLLVVELGRGHTLERMCLYLLGAELNIRFAYPLMLRPNGSPAIALAVDDPMLAGQILRRKEFKLLGETISRAARRDDARESTPPPPQHPIAELLIACCQACARDSRSTREKH